MIKIFLSVKLSQKITLKKHEIHVQLMNEKGTR